MLSESTKNVLGSILLRLAGKVLTQNECIEQSYVEEVVENVKQNGPYIVISEGVALAHANNRGNVHRSTISLLTNKQKSLTDLRIIFK